MASSSSDINKCGKAGPMVELQDDKHANESIVIIRDSNDEYIPLVHNNKKKDPRNVTKMIKIFVLLATVILLSLSFLPSNLSKLVDTEKDIGHSALIKQREKYLLFYPHAGFSNQMHALEKASVLAAITNRTLVLPPVLPHCPERAINYDWGCWMGKGAPSAIEQVKYNGRKVGSGARFPSFTEIVDFDLLVEQSPSYKEMTFIDLPEFIVMLKEKYNSSTVDEIVNQHFYAGNSTALEKSLQNKELPANETIKAFIDELGEHEIAVVGSAFAMNPHIEEVYDMKEGCFYYYPPSKKFLQTLKRILEIIGTTNYIGAHIRIDDHFISSPEKMCQKETKGPFIDLTNQMKNVTNNKNDTVVYLGLSHPLVKECLMNISNNEFNHIVTLPDIFENDNQTHQLMSSINLEWNTIILILDQLLLGLSGQFISTTTWGKGRISTFQWGIKERHSHRDEVLLLIEASQN